MALPVNLSAEPERACIERVLGGDLDAFAELVRMHHERVRNAVAATFPYADRVDDVSQEIFLRAYRQLPRYENARPFWPWLRGIAVNTLREQLRIEYRLAREKKSFAEAALLREAESSLRSNDSNVGSLQQLRDCLSRLSGRARMILRSFYEEGRSTGQIGAELGCGGSAVRNSLIRLRLMLRQCVEKHLPAEEGSL